MILGLSESHSKQLVLPFCGLDLGTHLLRVYAQILALVFQLFDSLIVPLLDLHETLKFVLIPF